ncbi:MAG TPA: carboxy terminal-processing peptidase [Steroidobacteraceae bacterium]|nr:carboxy terminal-processing peptidase [Steroidobacteraceae bacterium]
MKILKRFERPSAAWAVPFVAVMMVLALTGSSQAPAGPSVLPPNAIAPTDRERAIARRVGSILEEAHYRHVLIDAHMSSDIFDRYIESLDGQHSYLLASDLKEFEQWRYRFDDMIHTGDVEPGFAIFARYQQRNRERIAAALKMLDTEPDWTLDESMEFDRKDAPWATTSAQLDELWRKRVKNDGLSLLLTGKSWKEAQELLHKRYEHVLKRVDQISSDDVFENLMNAYARTFDPHSNFFSPRDSEEYRITMSLNYDGIGASLQQTDDYVQVMNVIEGGPAAVAGTLKPNDRITGVQQGSDSMVTDVVGWRLDDVVQLIRGKAGTVVKLQVLPAGAAPGSPEKMLVFTRNKVNLDNQAAKQEIRTVTRNGRPLKIGVITIPSFYQDVAQQAAGDPNYRSTTRDVRRLLGELTTAGVDGIVLDLRDDGGGYLPEATALTGLFIDKGPVVQLKDATGRVEVLDDPDSGIAYSGPLSVLVNRYSASASEIFAGALQDYHRAYILGQRTFGKGTVQNLIPLDRWSQKPLSGQITVTIGKFYRVTGESTQHHGVEPDVQLPSVIDMKEVGESALEAALPWDRIQGSPFTAWHDERPVIALPSLVSEETAREQHDPDYRYLVDDVAALNKVRAEKTLSLNLKVRQEERAQLDKERLERANQRLIAEGQPPVKTVEELDSSEAVAGDGADGSAGSAVKRSPKNGTSTATEAPPDLVLSEATQVMADILLGGPPNQHLPGGAPAQQTVKR